MQRHDQPATDSQNTITYYHLDGAERNDPGDDIICTNLACGPWSRPDIPIDYQASLPKANIGATELWGLRCNQEDRLLMDVCTDTDLVEIFKDEYIAVLNETVALLQHYVTGSSTHHCGATLCGTFILGTSVYTLNLGDSTAYLCTLGETNPQIKRLNTLLHNPSEPDEYDRIVSMGGHVIDGRISGGEWSQKDINLSRALGDNDVELNGLIHLPDIYTDFAPKSGKSFVIVACDGLTEKKHSSNFPCLSENDIARIVAESTPLDDMRGISGNLAKQALAKGSKDNVSVGVTNINADSQELKYMVIFDGHSGDLTSELARKIFAPLLEFNLRFALLKKSCKESCLEPRVKTRLETIIAEVKHSIHTAADMLAEDYTHKANFLGVRRSALFLKSMLAAYNNTLKAICSDLDECTLKDDNLEQNNNLGALQALNEILLTGERAEKYYHDSCVEFKLQTKCPIALISQIFNYLNEYFPADYTSRNMKIKQQCVEVGKLYQASQVIYVAKRITGEVTPPGSPSDFENDTNVDNSWATTCEDLTFKFGQLVVEAFAASEFDIDKIINNMLDEVESLKAETNKSYSDPSFFAKHKNFDAGKMKTLNSVFDNAIQGLKAVLADNPVYTLSLR